MSCVRQEWTGSVLTMEAEETTATFDRYARLTSPSVWAVALVLVAASRQFGTT